MVATLPEVKLLTADDLLRLDSKGVKGELIRGVLCKTMSAGGEHGEIVVNLVTELRNFVRPRRLGRLAASDSGVLLERSPDTVREPDIVFYSAEKIPPGVRVTRYYEEIPDLVVEVASPSDSLRELNDKARMWLSYGTRLVWVLHPNTRSVDVHPLGSDVATVSGDDTLNGGEVLTGFRVQLVGHFRFGIGGPYIRRILP